MLKSEYQLEEQYLSILLDKLGASIRTAKRTLEEADARLLEENRTMWEQTRHVVRDIDDMTNILMHNRLLGLDYNAVQLAAKELEQLSDLLDSPYFGRIDFQEPGEETLRVYIGRRVYYDAETMEFYIYDWRSPIASMFYDYDTGPAGYESPMGPREGLITRKRQYRIEGGKLLSAVEADALVRDDILTQVLSQAAGGRLRVIASSIQKEQNRAIRSLSPNNTLVTGPAGSGKTSVGLHRMAHLLYHNRGKLNAQSILAVSANHAFNEYIAGVLPELYEAELKRAVFGDLIARYLPKDMAVEAYDRQVEALLNMPAEAQRARWVQALYSVDFVRHLEQTLNTMPIEPGDVSFDGQIIKPKSDFALYMQVEDALDYRAKIRRMEEAIDFWCADYFRENAQAIRVAVEDKVEKDGLDIYTDREMKRHIERLAKDCAADNKRRLRQRNQLFTIPLLLRVISSYPAIDLSQVEALDKRLRKRRIFFEDALALLCVRSATGEVESDLSIQHVLVDEAQDYGPMQHHLLRALFPRAAFTLLADVHQTILPQIGLTHAHDFARLYPGTLEAFELTKSYRSTGPINAYAIAALGAEADMEAYDRPGPEPDVRAVPDLGVAVTQILGAPYRGSTAVITVTQREAEALYARIAKDVSCTLLGGPGDGEPGQVTVMPLYMAKGLEFDRVIVAGGVKGRCGAGREANALYLLCTRALHDLHVLLT